ncbi:hypothetical protein HZB93_01610 [Candidatus Falkowbacteria bacterium]|nr:hypothetical protein [Candidatus Falkowbacteria bacterium]
MGEVVSIFADGRLHRQILDRIKALEPTSMNNCLFLRLTATGDLHHEWLINHVVYRFIVNGGERTLTGRCVRVQYWNNEKNNHYAGIEFRDPETGREEPLGEWETLEIVFIAGTEERSFTATKNKGGAPEVKEIS